MPNQQSKTKASSKAASGFKATAKKLGSKLAPASMKKALSKMAKASTPVNAKKAKPAKATPPAKNAAPAKGKAAAIPAAKGAAAATGKKGAPSGKSAEARAAAAGRERQNSVAKALANAKASKAGGQPAVRAETLGDAVCREVACEGLATSNGYCRLHYIKNWKKIKRKEQILREGKLNQYIEELVSKYPDKYIEAIRQDLANDKDFAKVIYDLELDEGVDEFEAEGESMEGVIDNIKRDFEDEGEGPF